MKTFRQFSNEASFAIENLVSEAEGFKDAVNRRRKKKKKFLSDREAKIQKLKNCIYQLFSHFITSNCATMFLLRLSFCAFLRN